MKRSLGVFMMNAALLGFVCLIILVLGLVVTTPEAAVAVCLVCGAVLAWRFDWFVGRTTALAHQIDAFLRQSEPEPDMTERARYFRVLFFVEWFVGQMMVLMAAMWLMRVPLYLMAWLWAMLATVVTARLVYSLICRTAWWHRRTQQVG
jgi:hypothetical protein